MEQLTEVIYLSVFLFGFGSCAIFPVDKCKLEDSSCMLPAFQTAMPLFIGGLPEQGVELMDPMELDDIAFDLAGLQFTLKEGRLKGMKGSVMDKVQWNLKKNKFEIDFHLNGSVRGHYTAGGRLLILPISGDGQMRLKLRNVFVQLYIDYKMVTGEDGKQHVKPLKYDFKFEVRDNANFHLTGLFNGNEELSNTLLTFLNENWKQVVVEFGRPIMDAAAKKLFKGISAFFDSVPIEDIADL